MTMKTKQGLKGRLIESNGHKQVDKLPPKPEYNESYWLNSPNGTPSYTHHLFRFPAKLHPPIVQWALGKYGRKGSAVLDPFTGSGTVQVEALTRGISSLGIDIDPVACLITKAKITPLNPTRLDKALEKIETALTPFIRPEVKLTQLIGADITLELYEKVAANLVIPPIPNIFHWFKRYVIVDLARVFEAIESSKLSKAEALFFKVCAAAIIRRASNADPDPVSGLEVTRIQIERNLTRKIDVIGIFLEKARREAQQMHTLWEACHTLDKGKIKATAEVMCGDALKLDELLTDKPLAPEGFPLIITSPPYCRAVDYSRRHQLEMYWLGFVKDAAEHIALGHQYLGRRLVRVADWDESESFGIKELNKILQKIAKRDPHKARTVHHYFKSMSQVMTVSKKVLKPSGTLVCVIGDSVCCGVSIPTADFVARLAQENFTLQNRFSYALRNHHMQYGLWNGDGIKQEHVLVMKP